MLTLGRIRAVPASYGCRSRRGVEELSASHAAAAFTLPGDRAVASPPEASPFPPTHSTPPSPCRETCATASRSPARHATAPPHRRCSRQHPCAGQLERRRRAHQHDQAQQRGESDQFSFAHNLSPQRHRAVNASAASNTTRKVRTSDLTLGPNLLFTATRHPA